MEASSEANELFAALLTLERNAQVAELKAAKVPQHTIDSLFPHVFEDLIPGLIEYFSDYDLAAFDGTDEWADHAGSTSSLLRDVSVDMSALSKREFEQFARGDERDLLHEHIAAGLSGRVTGLRTRAMIDSLWYAHWFMLHLEESGAISRVQDHFVEIMQWLLPDLRERVAFQIEAGRYVAR